MNRLRQVWVLIFVVCLTSTGLVIPHARAQDSGFSITTSPLPIKLNTEPGKSVSADLRVQNSGTETERIKVGLMKFSASGEEGRPQIMDRAAGDDYFDWVKFSPSVFDAPPKQWITVKMTINVPTTAGLGYYYAVTFSRESNPIAGNKSAVVGSTATLVLLNVKSPNEKRSVEFVSISASHKVYEFLPAEFSIKVFNNGNIHLIPAGNIFITKGGKNIATLNINDAQGSVLPQTNRIFSASWKDGFPVYVDKITNDKPVVDKKGNPERSLSWNFSQASKLRFGKYTAKAVVVYNDGTRDVPLQGTVSFWVIPWRIIGGTIFVIAFTTIGMMTVGRGVWRKTHGRKFRGRR